MPRIPENPETPPTAEPITKEEVKAKLRIDHTTEDPELDRMIVAARRYCEKAAGRRFITQTWLEHWENFPGEFVLAQKPVQSVTSIKYIDVGGVQQTLAASVYQSTLVTVPARIKEERNQVWPTVIDDTYDSITLEYIAGYGDEASAVPAEDKEAIRRLVVHWHINPDAWATREVGTEIEMTLRSLLNINRVWSFP